MTKYIWTFLASNSMKSKKVFSYLLTTITKTEKKTQSLKYISLDHVRQKINNHLKLIFNMLFTLLTTIYSISIEYK